MKTKLTVIFSVLGLLVFTLQSATAISITDYKFPQSTSQEAWLDGNFSLDGNSSDDSQVGFDFGGSVSYDAYYRSLPFTYQFNTLGTFSVTRTNVKDAESENAYNAWVFTKANKYLNNESNLFGYGSSEFDYRKQKTQDEADDPYAKITVGAGYGRSIDATVLKRAMRINEDFKKFNVISGDIPDKEMLELAKVIDRENEFRSRYGGDVYEQYWYEAMEEVLQKSGVLRESGLGAIGTIRISEVLQEKVAPSYYGWEARAGIGIVLSDYNGEKGDPALEAVLDWARPYSTHLQLNNTASFNTVFQEDPTHKIQNIFQAYYELSDKIDWDNTLQVNYDIVTATETNQLRVTFNSRYIFDIKNDLYFDPTFSFNYTDLGIEGVDAEWNWKVYGGVTYRLK